MTPRSSNRLAWTLWATGLSGIAFGLILDTVTRRPGDWSYITQVFAFFATGTTGLIVARKQPGNLIGYGTGLQGMADRLAALGGELEIASTPGAGTLVAGRSPAEGTA
jgi:hypothetical protein